MHQVDDIDLKRNPYAGGTPRKGIVTSIANSEDS